MNMNPQYVRSGRTISGAVFCIFAAVIILIVGILFVLSDIQTKDYPVTDATILAFHEVYDADNERSYETIVSYTVDGVEYKATIGYSSFWKKGDTVQIKYNPNNPAEAMEKAEYFGYIILAVGVVVLFFSIRGIKVNAKRCNEREAQDKAIREGRFVPQDDPYGTAYEPNTEVKYYFTLDKHLMQGGYMEDVNRIKVYEAVFDKFTLLTDTPCTFTNHVNYRQTHHKIGHTLTTRYGSSMCTRSTFKYDGQDVWDYLHNNGIRIQTDFTSSMTAVRYTVTRLGKPYAVVTTCGPKIHEEDAGTGLLAGLSAARGFYRITSYSDDIDLLFLTVFTFSRVEQIFCD